MWKVLSQGMHMCNMKALSLLVRKLWLRLKCLFTHTRRRRRGHRGYDISSLDIRPGSLKIVYCWLDTLWNTMTCMNECSMNLYAKSGTYKKKTYHRCDLFIKCLDLSFVFLLSLVQLRYFSTMLLLCLKCYKSRISNYERPYGNINFKIIQ